MLVVLHTNTRVSEPISRRTYDTFEEACEAISASSHEAIDDVRRDLSWLGQFALGCDVWALQFGELV